MAELEVKDHKIVVTLMANGSLWIDHDPRLPTDVVEMILHRATLFYEHQVFMLRIGQAQKESVEQSLLNAELRKKGIIQQ